MTYCTADPREERSSETGFAVTIYLRRKENGNQRGVSGADKGSEKGRDGRENELPASRGYSKGAFIFVSHLPKNEPVKAKQTA